MTDPQDALTPEETAQLRELLRRNQAESAAVKFVKNLPGIGRWLGNVGRYVVFAVGFSKILDVCLVPAKIEESYQYYKPKIQATYVQLAEAMNQLKKTGIDPNSLPPTTDYIVFDPQLPITTTTTTTSTPGTSGNVTVVASTGVPPAIIAGSGVIPRPSSWS